MMKEKEQERLKNNLPVQHDFLKELEHIHNKVIFDAFNEALDNQRIFGLLGRPFPWKTNQNRLNEQELTNKDIPKTLRVATDKTIEWASYLCGIIFDKEDSPFMHQYALDEDYVTHIKEDRMARMLAGEVVESEYRWIVYDDEQTEVFYYNFIYLGLNRII